MGYFTVQLTFVCFILLFIICWFITSEHVLGTDRLVFKDLTCIVWREGWPLQSSGTSLGFPPEQAEAPPRDWREGDL